MDRTRRRLLAGGAQILGAAALAPALFGCASRARPEPAELPRELSTLGVHPVWSLQLPGKVGYPLQPAVVGERLLLASDDGQVLTLDGASGRQLGQAGAGAALNAGVGSNGRVAAVVTRANEVVALQDGRVAWQRRLGTQAYTAPLVAGGRVFVLGADRSLTAFDAGNGARLWHVERRSEPLVLRQGGLLMPVGNTLVAGLSGRMVGVNPDTGDILWEAPLASARGVNDIEKLIDLLGGTWRQQDVVCARAFDAAVGCVDTRTGATLWTEPAHGVSGVTGDGERLYGVESDGRVRAWHLADGSRAWLSERLQWRRLGAPLLLGRTLVVGDTDDGAVYLLDRADGSLLGRVQTDKSGVAAAPVAVAGTLVVVTHGGRVFGFRTS